MTSKITTEKPTIEKVPRTRSPNYPAIPLAAALVKASVLRTEIGRHAAGLETVAKLWKLSQKSSTFRLWLAGLRAFGLLEDVADGPSRMVKLTSLALDILADYAAGSPDQLSAIQRAALKPPIHVQLRERYGPTLPADEEVRRYLVRERGFNDRTVGDFITRYKETMSHAKLGETDTIHRVGIGELVHPGDFVQWTNNGVDQYTEPRRVVGVSDDKDWVFVEGSPTGVPMTEVRIEAPKAKPTPPLNPFAKPSSALLQAGTAEERLTLDEGPVLLQWPADLSSASVREFEDWVAVLVRRLRRKAGLKGKG